MRRILDWLAGNPTEVKLELTVTQSWKVPVRAVVVVGLALILVVVFTGLCNWEVIAPTREPTPTPSLWVVGWV